MPWCRDDEFAVRSRWFLTECGRFPTYEEICAVRDHDRSPTIGKENDTPMFLS